MKQETQYICEYCGAKYLKEEQCQKCEEMHGIPKEIGDSRYSRGKIYPDTISLKKSNGKTIIYQYLKPILERPDKNKDNGRKYNENGEEEL